MFARIATFEGIDAGTSEDVMERVRDRAISILEGMPGWQGGMQLIDRTGGRVMTISFFDTEENMQAAESTFESMPQQIPEVREMAGGRSSVQRFEVLAETRR